MRLKHGASIAGLTDRARYMLWIIDSVYEEFGLEMTVTAGTENPELHEINSRHAYGDAIDSRIAKRYYELDIDRQKEIADRIRDRLIDVFDNTSDSLYPGFTFVQFHPDHHIHCQVK